MSESLETSDVKRTSHATLAMISQPSVASVMDEVPSSISKASRIVRICVREVRVLFNSCSSKSFIHPPLVDSLKLKVRPSSKTTVYQWPLLYFRLTLGHTCVNIMDQGQDYTCVPLGVLDHLCCNIQSEIDFQASVLFYTCVPLNRLKKLCLDFETDKM